jgi:hypothetical protein
MIPTKLITTQNMPIPKGNLIEYRLTLYITSQSEQCRRENMAVIEIFPDTFLMHLGPIWLIVVLLIFNTDYDVKSCIN